MESALCNLTLWHASGVEVPPELLRALSKRPGTTVTLVGDPFMALAEICIASRSGGKAGSARLVILFPEMLTDAAEFCAIADTYAPAVPRWLFGPASNPQLRAIVEDDVMQWSRRHNEPSAAPVASPSAASEVVVRPAAIREAERRTSTSRTTQAPQLRLAGEGPAHPALDNPPHPADGSEQLAGLGPDASQPPSPSPHLITDEELRMLLGESSTEGQQEHQ